MAKRIIPFAVLLVLTGAVLGASTALAVVPSDSLMPVATRGFASVGDFLALCEHWEQTQYGQLMHDEAMQPFVNSIKEQFQRKMSGARQKLGIDIDDIKSVAAGEIGFGLIEQEKSAAAVALTIDVHGRDDAVKTLLTKIDQDLTQRKAKRSAANSGGVDLTIYEIPPQTDKDIARTAVFFVHQDMFVATDSRIQAEEMIRRFDGAPGNRLADLKAYQQIMQQCAAEAKDLKPEVRWFLDPFNYAHAMRSMQREGAPERRGKDYISIFESQGFDAILGIGGYVNLALYDSFELLHRSYIYAPGLESNPEKYRLAMRMLQFPNGDNLMAQGWIPRKLASYRTFNMNLQNAYQHFGSLFDALAGYDNAFNDVIEGLEKDPYGPQVQVNSEFIQHLGSRVSIVTDYDTPITTKSERFVVVVDVKDEAAVAASIEKFMKADPNAHQREFEGKTVWEILPPENDVPELEIALDPLTPAEQPGGEAGKAAALSTSAVCVAEGQMFMASHMDFLQHVLTKKPQGEVLPDSGDFQQVQNSLNQLITGPVAARCFVRTDEAYRPTYELLRQGKMPEAETLLGRVLNRMLTTPEDEDEGVLRKQKIDGRALPNFEMVRRYFSPMGTAVRSTDDGWFIVGATLTKQSPQARAGAGTATEVSAVR